MLSLGNIRKTCAGRLMFCLGSLGVEEFEGRFLAFRRHDPLTAEQGLLVDSKISAGSDRSAPVEMREVGSRKPMLLHPDNPHQRKRVGFSAWSDLSLHGLLCAGTVCLSPWTSHKCQYSQLTTDNSRWMLEMLRCESVFRSQNVFLEVQNDKFAINGNAPSTILRIVEMQKVWGIPTSLHSCASHVSGMILEATAISQMTTGPGLGSYRVWHGWLKLFQAVWRRMRWSGITKGGWSSQIWRVPSETFKAGGAKLSHMEVRHWSMGSNSLQWARGSLEAKLGVPQSSNGSHARIYPPQTNKQNVWNTIEK